MEIRLVISQAIDFIDLFMSFKMTPKHKMLRANKHWMRGLKFKCILHLAIE